MRKRIDVFISTLVMVVAVFSVAVFFSGCDDDGDGEEKATLAGQYTFSSAVVAADITHESVTIPAGTNVTPVMVSALLAEAPCDADPPINAAVDLRTNNELWFICIGETNEEKGGTWSENNDLTQMTLNITVDVNGTPTPFPVTVSEVVKTSSKIVGVLKGFPISGELMVPMYALTGNTWPQDLAPPAVKLADVDIEFSVIP